MDFSQLILWTWILPSVLSQTPTESLALPDQFGNCDPIDETILETGYPTDEGLVGSTLHAVYTPSSSTFPVVSISSFRILCESRSPINNKIASTTVVVEYTCSGSACVSSNNRNLLSFFCAPEIDRFMIQSSVVDGFADSFSSVSEAYPEVVEFGTCTLCGIDITMINDNPLIGDRYYQRAGCVRMLIDSYHTEIK